ncbi:MAG: DUF1572 family protein [Saprospiraceae bacterium]|nr:DUF1572 family protein [Candidatus Opimibacter skivensis]
MTDSTLKNTINVFEYYKSLGEKAMAQITDEALFQMPDEKSNSISVIVKHLHGNMLSRWTDFLTTDGEKEWRDRDSEFEETIETRDEVMKQWNEGWACVFSALNTLHPEDFDKTVYIRNMGQTVLEAIMRQMAHYAYHIGQIVYLARLFNEGDWKTLTIPKGGSAAYNKEKNAPGKRIEHFTEETKAKRNDK